MYKSLQYLLIVLLFALIPAMAATWILGIKPNSDKWPIAVLFLFIGWLLWMSGYKYGCARGWAEIEVRMLPVEERRRRGVYLDDDECIPGSDNFGRAREKTE